MGALTNNRKRGDDYFNLNFKTLAPPTSPHFDHVSKKPRLSSFSNQNSVPKPTKSSVSRFFLYPAAITPIRREVHAPCRKIRFRSNSSSYINYKEDSAPQMGNVLSRQFDRAKIGQIHTLRNLKKDEEVIDIDDETAKEGASGDSSNEQVEARGEGRAKRVLSLSRGQEPMETDGVVEILDSFDGKDAERNFQPSYSSAVTGLNDAILKVETAGKILDSLSVVNRPSYSSYLPLYKQLLGTAEKRNDNLKQLQFQIEVNEKLRETYKLLRPQKKELIKEDVITEPFVPLTKEEEAEVSRALSNSNRRRILVTHENSNIDISGEILQCLRPGAWLNDEVINVYLELLKEREKREPKKFLKCHFFNTFFYKKLLSGRGGYNYQSVRRWTSQRKLGYCLLECDKIFVPIHKEIHWCLAVINVKDEKFQYLDSLGVMDTQVLKLLARYFADEVKDKSGKEVHFNSWKQESVEDLPEQMNGYDCGMFMIKYADFYSRGIGLCFNQEHMPYFRLRTAKELLSLKAE